MALSEIEAVFLEAAKRYAEHGFAIFPVWGIDPETKKCQCGNPKCEDAGKHPITPKGLLDATTEIQKITIWWHKYPCANIGIVTGEKSGIVVLDVDGPEGQLSLADKPLPNTPTVSTGKGLHHYFKYPGFPVKNSVRKLGKGLDIRGDRGYVVAPPSRHVSGNVYGWTVDYATTELADLPEWILANLPNEITAFEKIESDGVKAEKGTRNIYLTSIAGAMRRKDMGYAAIRAALIEHNRDKCEPPLEEEEVEKIALSISGKDSSDTFSPKVSITIFDEMLGEVSPNDLCRTAPLTDVGNAQVFVSLYGDRFRYDHTRKRWMVWLEGAGVWREDMGSASHRAMIASVRLRDQVAATLQNPIERDALEKCARGAERNRGINYALEHATSFKGISVLTSDFDTRPYLLNFLNGTLNLDTLEFREAKREDMISRQMAVAYDPTATAPRWEQFISEIFDGDTELMGYVQRSLGYCLSGRTNEQAFFIAHGNGANGKSTLFNTVRKIMGDYGANTAFSTFDADNRNQYGNDLAALKARRFVIAMEAEQSKRLAEARVKTVTGGEPVVCRFLYGEFFEMLPEFKVWLAVNHKPLIRGADHGIWRRIHLIPFSITFGEEGKYPMDKNLEQKLTEEYSGIVNWLIEGYQLWRTYGLNPPEVVKMATKEYKRENDTVALWVDDRCNKGPEEKMKASEGYQDFVQYLKDTGEIDRAIPSMRTWGTLMGEKGYQKVRRENGYVYLGVSIRPLTLSDGSRGN